MASDGEEQAKRAERSVKAAAAAADEDAPPEAPEARAEQRRRPWPAGKRRERRVSRRKLVALADHDELHIAEGEPDIRGWPLRASDGIRVGAVHELLVDTATLRVRYLDVALDVPPDAPAEHHVLVPIGLARLIVGTDAVRTPTVGPDLLSALPAFQHGAVTRRAERALLRQLGTTVAARPADLPPARDFYAHVHFDDRGFWGSRGSGPGYVQRR